MSTIQDLSLYCVIRNAKSANNIARLEENLMDPGDRASLLIAAI